MSLDAFVESDKFRRAVFTEIAVGESDPGRIAKKHRMIVRAVERAVTDLAARGLIEKKGREGYQLTDEGRRHDALVRRKDSNL